MKRIKNIPLSRLLPALFFICFACVPSNNPGIVNNLAAYTNSGDRADQLTAIMLLSHTRLDEKTLKILDEKKHTSKDHLVKLYCLYTLGIRTQYVKYADEFIDAYPEGKDQKILWNRDSSTSKYVSASSPLQGLLARYAKTNDTALKKLISGMPYADGVDGEILEDHLHQIYQKEPKRVRDFMKEMNIMPETWQLK